jgi:hypothetical protein
MKKRIASSSNRDGLAADIIRKEKDIWPGVGVYTVDEVFWLAGMCFCPRMVLSMCFSAVDIGLSLGLTEAEVFSEDDSSRLTRLILALWTWDRIGRKGIW